MLYSTWDLYFDHGDPNAWWYVKPSDPLPGGGDLFMPSHSWGAAPYLAQFCATRVTTFTPIFAMRGSAT